MLGDTFFSQRVVNRWK